ncbi:hypothetical protein EVA_18783, partial [gut metagenome]
DVTAETVPLVTLCGLPAIGRWGSRYRVAAVPADVVVGSLRGSGNGWGPAISVGRVGMSPGGLNASSMGASRTYELDTTYAQAP